jgi:hypothetical protein
MEKCSIMGLIKIFLGGMDIMRNQQIIIIENLIELAIIKFWELRKERSKKKLKYKHLLNYGKYNNSF